MNLNNLPLELISEVNSYLRLKDFVQLEMTCKRFNQFENYNGNNYKYIQQEFNDLLKKCEYGHKYSPISTAKFDLILTQNVSRLIIIDIKTWHIPNCNLINYLTKLMNLQLVTQNEKNQMFLNACGCDRFEMVKLLPSISNLSSSIRSRN